MRERLDAGGGGGMVLVEDAPARSCRAAVDDLVLWLVCKSMDLDLCNVL